MDNQILSVAPTWALWIVAAVMLISPLIYRMWEGNIRSCKEVIEEEIRVRLNKPDGELTQTDLDKVTVIGFYKSRISDLSYIGNLTKVQELFLHNNEITDLGALSTCSLLKKLTLSGNKITNLGPLSNLTQLNILSLNKNQITDLSPLAELIGLRTLQLSNNRITDLSPLLGLVHLETLTLENQENLSAAELERLKKSLPACKIYCDSIE